MARFSQEDALLERIRWLIRLRWIAIIGVVTALLFSVSVLKLSLPIRYQFTVVLILISYNLAFPLSLSHIRKRVSKDRLLIANRIANLQISLDLASLSALIHFSGGIENPFIFYFIFHMIIASILLSRRASFLQATLAISFFSIIVILEYTGALPHYCLKGFIIHDQHDNLLYISGIYLVFMSTLYISVYMATSISRRLREREEKLKQLNELLTEKDRIKSEYVLRVTHDIKEHISAIQGCLEPVTAGITGPLNAKQTDLLGRAVQRTEKLILFIRALLEITRIKLSKKIEMRHFSVKEMIASAINSVDAKAKAKGIVISFDIDPAIDTMMGAQIYLEEAVTNILANSVKYTPRNGKIDISVKDEGDSILVRLADTGIGIPPEEIDKVFDEFHRASNAVEIERDGTGLGLSIARQIIERHNGRIWVESELGKGSAFYIKLVK